MQAEKKKQATGCSAAMHIEAPVEDRNRAFGRTVGCCKCHVYSVQLSRVGLDMVRRYSHVGYCEDSLFHSAIHVQTQDTGLRSGYDAFSNCKQTSPSILNADFQDLPRVKFIEFPIFNCTEPALADWQTHSQQISTFSLLLVGVCLNIGFPAISSAGPPGTAPFPFCGNRLEFRAVGSSQNCCFPVMVCNAIMSAGPLSGWFLRGAPQLIVQNQGFSRWLLRLLMGGGTSHMNLPGWEPDKAAFCLKIQSIRSGMGLKSNHSVADVGRAHMLQSLLAGMAHMAGLIEGGMSHRDAVAQAVVSLVSLAFLLRVRRVPLWFFYGTCSCSFLGPVSTPVLRNVSYGKVNRVPTSIGVESLLNTQNQALCVWSQILAPTSFNMYLPTARKPAQRFCVFFLRCDMLGGGGWGGGV